jgi:hypothetical protein
MLSVDITIGGDDRIRADTVCERREVVAGRDRDGVETAEGADMLVEDADGFGLFIGEREVKIMKFEELLATLSSSGQVWVEERARRIMGGRSESGVPRGSGSRVGQTDGVDGSGNWRWMNRRCTEIRIRWFGNRRVVLEVVVRLREAMRGRGRGGVGHMVSRGRRRGRGERGERGRRGRNTGTVLE